MQFLVAEDDSRMARLLEQGLAEEGHHITVAQDGESALGFALAHSFDAIVLDIMLPRMDGLAVARRLRSASIQTPILILTARDSDRDLVTALDLGADDYLTKPFSFDVLLARLRAICRRSAISHEPRLTFAGLSLDPGTRNALRAGHSIPLTPREYALLELLLRNAGRVVPRDRILDSVWGYDTEVNENTVEAFVRLLRNKIDPPGQPKLIHTVRGVGYSLRAS